MEDGSAPPERIPIERLCNGTSRREAYTDAEGDFQFELGQDSETQDASDSSRRSFGSNTANSGVSSGVSRREMQTCELRATFPGFQPAQIDLSAFQSDVGMLSVGTLVLKRIGNAPGTTISLTTLQAPNDARDAYQKAQKDLAKKKDGEAEKQLTKAVQIYPHFAAAWFLLGRLHEERKQTDQAAQDYLQAVSAEPNFVSPYFHLGVIALRDKKWKEAAQFSDKVAELNPYAFPQAFFCNAVAKYNLGNLDGAEKSVRTFQSMDTTHRVPQSSLLLAAILAAKHEYSAAADQDRSYLQALPNAPDSANVRSEVKRLEDLAKATPPPH
jgi:tetratricopeptide (TPR) repeat protein